MVGGMERRCDEKSEIDENVVSEQDEMLIEQLVDGELADEEREKLFRRLEEKADGWRCCALSFLEAQTFRSSMKNVGEAPRSSDRKLRFLRRNLETSTLGKRLRKSWIGAGGTAVAALALVVLAANIFDSKGDAPFKYSPNGSAIVSNARMKSNTNNAEHSTGAEGTRMFSNFDASAARSSAHEAIAVNGTHEESSLPNMVTLNNPAQGLSNITTTCKEFKNYDPGFFQAVNSAVPQEVVNHMYDVGGSLDVHRDEYRFSLDGDRVLILPVDTYNVVSDGNQSIW